MLVTNIFEFLLTALCVCVCFSLVQIKEKEARIKDMIHESSKPLARYADDSDLEAMLKAQEREGDPMLEYLREKRQKANPYGKYLTDILTK